MLYFTIRTDRKADQLTPKSTDPLYLVIQKELHPGPCLYSIDKGTICIYNQFSTPDEYQDYAKGFDTVDSIPSKSIEYNLIKNALFYSPKGYNEKYLKERYANSLEMIFGRVGVFDEFDTGAIWSTLVSIHLYLSKFVGNSNLIHEKERNRLARFITNSVINLDHACGFHSKLTRACREFASNYPTSIKNIKDFCARKAFISLCYLILLPVKELIVTNVVNEDCDIIEFLHSCIKNISTHTYSACFEFLYNEETDSDVINNLLISNSANHIPEIS